MEHFRVTRVHVIQLSFKHYVDLAQLQTTMHGTEQWKV